MPAGMVIDPLAVRQGIEPNYYIGQQVEMVDLQSLLLNRKHPLDVYVTRTDKKEHEQELYRSYMEAYNLHIEHASGHFPPQLIRFAEQNGLSVPPQERSVIKT